MKTSLILALLSCLCLQGFSKEKFNKLSVNPIQLFVYGITNFEYERGFNDGKLGVAFFYGMSGMTTREIGDHKAYASEQNVSVKRYSNNFSTNSFWYGGQISVATASVWGDEGQAFDIGTLCVSSKSGYQVILNSFYLDFFGSLGYVVTNDLYGKATYEGDVAESNIILFLGVKMGIAF